MFPLRVEFPELMIVFIEPLWIAISPIVEAPVLVMESIEPPFSVIPLI